MANLSSKMAKFQKVATLKKKLATLVAVRRLAIRLDALAAVGASGR
jgi:hypothetical protein